jgi:hypothetical protein
MQDDLSLSIVVKQSNNKGAIFVDKKYIGRLASIVDADDSNRPGENTIFGAPNPEFPNVTKEITRNNDQGLIELPPNWIGRSVHVFTI